MQAARFVPLLLLLALPFTAYAGPIPADSLVLDYEGTILAVSEESPPPDGYAVGDSLAGRLLINRGVLYFSNVVGNGATYESADPEFVSGFWPALSNLDGFDQVFIANELMRTGDTRPIDIFSVEDLFVTRNGSLDGAETLSIGAAVRGFLDNVSLDQSFELTQADVDEPEESLGGMIRWSNLGPFPFVSFLIDKLSVKPGRCFAP
jgi:hypothetical protein